MLVKIPNVKFHKNSLGRSRHIYTGGRKDERTEIFEEHNGRLQNFFAKAPKHASSRNNVEGYALASAGSMRGRVGLQAQQKVANFFVS
jgi:hypothetical protein